MLGTANKGKYALIKPTLNHPEKDLSKSFYNNLIETEGVPLNINYFSKTALGHY